MIEIIRTLDLNRRTTAILQNAYAISYMKQVNAIWQASFSLPLNDPKVAKVELLRYIEITDEDEYIGLFRIIPKLTIKNESTQEVRFQCEHVLSTLLDKSLFKYHQRSNYTTNDNIDYLLAMQNHKHWRRGKGQFTRYFHYSWENINLISALFSIPKPFDESYLWEYDTKSYPWTLNLVKPDMEPICRIKEGYNLIGLEIEENPMGVYNRIYPLGAGEGVNQLTIESVNNGVPYIEDRKPGEEIREYIWVDQRFTDSASMKASASSLLKRFKEPQVTWKVSAADVSSITGLSVDKFKVGKVVRLDVADWPTVDLRIMKVSRSDIKGSPGDVQLEIGNVVEDLATTQADLQRRQQINELYSQGATNILNFTYQDNCDEIIPAVIPFTIDNDVVNINTIELTFRTKKFRAYSQATQGGGAIVKSTKGGGGTTKSTTSGGGTTATSTSGGGVAKSTASGGGSSQTSSSGGGSTQSSSAGGDHRHTVLSGSSFGTVTETRPFNARTSNGSVISVKLDATSGGDITTFTADGNHSHSVSVPSHTHGVAIPNHSHSFDVPNHSHNVSIPAHSHDVTIPAHTHEIELPNHTHAVEHKIVELSSTPSSVIIKVDGNVVPHTATSGDRINLVDYMSKDSNGRITRGRHEVQILPNGLARIEADLILRVFIQSQLGGNF